MHIERIKINTVFKNISFILLCAYLAFSYLSYIPGVPQSIVTLMLYGFVAVSVCTMIFSRKVKLNAHVKWYGVFIIACFFSALYSVSQSASVAMVVQLLKIWAFLFCFSNIVDTSPKMKAVFGVLSLSAEALYLYLVRTDQLIVEDSRLGNDFIGNANTFSTLFMLGAFGSVYYIVFADKKITKIIAAAIFVSQEFALALAGGRKFFILPILLLAGQYVLQQGRGGRKHVIVRGLVAVALLVLVGYLVINVPLLYNAIGYRFEGFIDGVTGKGAYDASSEIRFNMVRDALGFWESRPLFGYGVDSFKSISIYGTYSHNNYAELLCDVGFIGAAIYYFYVVITLRESRRIKSRGAKKTFWLLLLVCMLVFEYGAVSYSSMLSQLVLLMMSNGFRLNYKEEFCESKRL